jgi:predicted ArsR family transcriptional regulator
MVLHRWTRRFFESTRGRIVALLRSHPSTIDELSAALALTDNAVRAQLAVLERDNLVEHVVRRRPGAGKPAYTYALTASAEVLLSAAYAPLLAGLLDALGERKSRRDQVALMRAAGKHMASGSRVALGSVRRRIGSAIDFLNELGAVAELERCNGSALIKSRNCPLTAVVGEHPAACEALASAVEMLAGARTAVRCRKIAGRPECGFEVTLSSARGR